MHPDHLPYANYMTRANMEKALNSLSGILEGIAIDGKITKQESEFLQFWIRDNADVLDLHPCNEFLPLVQVALENSWFGPEERENLQWLFDRLRSSGYYSQTTADLQRLHAIVAGIVIDGTVTEQELRELSHWLRDHSHLATCWPYDEIDSLVTAVMADGKIDEKEHGVLRAFFSEFVAIGTEQTILNPLVSDEYSCTVTGLCATSPSIKFDGSKFCFTGASLRYSRAQVQELVERLGGIFRTTVSPKIDYLVIGADGNPCWAYACYGRKVEQAVKLRKEGSRILLVHESDFHDAVADEEM
jgi:hypothetical protein